MAIILFSYIAETKKSMPIHLRNTICYLIVAYCSCGCASVYVPSIRNVPLFTRRGESQLQTSIGNGINATAAYAITNHIAISAGGLYANNKNLLKNDWRIHQSAEVALGGYGVKKNVSFELFVGYGGGKGYGEEIIWGGLFGHNTWEKEKASYQKYFIQPSVGFTHKKLQFIGTIRVSRLDFTDIYVGPLDGTAFSYDIPQKSFVFIEPSFSLKLFPVRRYPPLFILWQFGLNVRKNDNNKSDFRYSILHYEVGVGLKFKRK